MFPYYLLDRIKTVLGIWSIDEDNVLKEFIGNFIQMINLYVGADTFPTELEFIVVECTVARYLRMGSEGYESESLGEVSITYQDILTPYIAYLDTYKSTNKKVKFL